MFLKSTILFWLVSFIYLQTAYSQAIDANISLFSSTHSGGNSLVTSLKYTSPINRLENNFRLGIKAHYKHQFRQDRKGITHPEIPDDSIYIYVRKQPELFSLLVGIEHYAEDKKFIIVPAVYYGFFSYKAINHIIHIDYWGPEPKVYYNNPNEEYLLPNGVGFVWNMSLGFSYQVSKSFAIISSAEFFDFIVGPISEREITDYPNVHLHYNRLLGLHTYYNLCIGIQYRFYKNI